MTKNLNIVLKENRIISFNDKNLEFPCTKESIIAVLGQDPSRIEKEGNLCVWDILGIKFQSFSESEPKYFKLFSVLSSKIDGSLPESKIPYYPKAVFEGKLFIQDKEFKGTKKVSDDILDYMITCMDSYSSNGLGCININVYSKEDKQEKTIIDFTYPVIAIEDSIPFADFNFKLLVIDALMYNQKVLEPIFNTRDFIDFYTAREIDIEKEGYEIIQETATYFKDLPIPKKFATLIEKLTQNGNIIYGEIFPFWDGEDDTFDIKSAVDAIHFPNLKEVTIFPNDTMDETVLNQFIKKGIKAEFL